MALTYYRDTDAGAPQLVGALGDFGAMVKAVLATGYGAGWTLEYESGTIRAIRNNPVSGSGTFYRLKDQTTNMLIIQGYGTYKDDVVLGQEFPPTTENHYWYCNSLTTGTRPWLVVADETTAIFIFGTYTIVQYLVIPLYANNVSGQLFIQLSGSDLL